jgi:hypothetical protein
LTFPRQLEHAEDAGKALYEFVSRVLEMVSRKRDLAEALERSGAKSKQSPEVEAMWRATIAPLVERARQSAAVRPDVEVDDVLFLVSGSCSAVINHNPDRETRTRMARVICDGLRP